VIFPRKFDSRYPYSPDGIAPAPGETPIADILIQLAWLASQTSLNLGTAAMVLPLRHPVLLAKELASLDHVTGGRFTLGVGMGWLKEEFTACDIPWERRGERADEVIEALRVLWSGADVSHHGKHFNFDDVSAFPLPLRPSSGVPIMVCGNTSPAARRAGRLGDGWMPMNMEPDDFISQLALVRRVAEEFGREAKDIEISYGIPPLTDQYDRLMSDPGEIRRYEDMGISRIMLAPPAQDLSTLSEALQAFSDNIMSKC
jgi:probable F420-dependent oxidoreductase